jgi:hypothetical protein
MGAWEKVQFDDHKPDAIQVTQLALLSTRGTSRLPPLPKLLE